MSNQFILTLYALIVKMFLNKKEDIFIPFDEKRLTFLIKNTNKNKLANNSCIFETVML